MLDSLCIKNFRCFEDLTIKSLGQVNLIVGKNNSGKTTLLEAILFFTEIDNKLSNSLLSDYDFLKIVLKGLRNLLELRNEFFIYEDISDFDIVFRSIYDIENFIIHFSNKSIENILEVGFVLSSEDGMGIYLLVGNKRLLVFLDKHRNLLKKEVSEEKLKKLIKQEYFIDKITDNLYEKKISKKIVVNLSMNYDLRKNNCRFVPSKLISENELGLLWDSIYQRNDDRKIIHLLRIVLPTISSIHFIVASKGDNNRAAFIKEEGHKEARPLKTMGEGVSRLLQIFLYAFLSRDGYLLIDEFENGLHYSIQADIWQKLFKLADALNIQVFVTTHSKDILESFAEVAKNETKTTANLISLGRSVAKSNRGQIISHVYKQEQLDWIINSGMEIR